MKKMTVLLAMMIILSAVFGFAQAFERALPVLISTEELAALMTSGEKLVIIDCRAPDLYKVAHIKGAINLYTRSIHDKSSLIENILPPVTELAELFGRNGISRDHRVVVYEDTSDAREAARMLLYLEVAGHNKTQFLDGGISKWSKEKREKTQAVPNTVPVTFVAQPQLQRFIITKAEVLANLNNPNFVIVDDRSPDEYTGKIAGTNVKRGGGHIPGAVNKDYKTVVNADGTFKSAAALIQEFGSIGVTADKQIILYCRTAVRSALSRIAVQHIVGFKNVLVYDGSMVEWSADETLPLVKGN